jgi:hypothetical protein
VALFKVKPLKINKMIAKEKAAELIVNYQLKCKSLNYDEAKQCAIIAVDEIIKALENELLDLYDTARDCPINKKHNQYWEQVKTEIENL